MTSEPTGVDDFIAQLEAGTSRSRLVQSQNGTLKENPYLTVNTSGADEFDEYAGKLDALFNDQPAYQAVLKESPRHRLILWMTANGQSPQQIATALGITRQTVYTVRKQPWFRAMFVRITESLGKDAATQLLKGEVLPSLQTLIEIRDDPTAKSADRRGAADSLLDRYLGKAVAKSDEGKAPADVASDVDQLKTEADRIAAELKAQGLSGFVPSPS